MAELIAEARELNDSLRACVLINAADARGQDNQEAIEAVEEVPGLEVLDVVIGRRKAFPNAAAAGRAVTEHTPKDAKAIEEMSQLAELLFLSDR
jgi:chromosome partitioning protein